MDAKMKLLIKKNKIEELKKYGFYYDEMRGAYTRNIDCGISVISTFVFINNRNFRYGEVICKNSICFDFISNERAKKINEDLELNDFFEEI